MPPRRGEASPLEPQDSRRARSLAVDTRASRSLGIHPRSPAGSVALGGLLSTGPQSPRLGEGPSEDSKVRWSPTPCPICLKHFFSKDSFPLRLRPLGSSCQWDHKPCSPGHTQMLLAVALATAQAAAAPLAVGGGATPSPLEKERRPWGPHSWQGSGSFRKHIPKLPRPPSWVGGS